MEAFEEQLRKMADDAKGEVDKRCLLGDLKAIRENMACRGDYLVGIDYIIKGTTFGYACRPEYDIKSRNPQLRDCPVDLTVSMGAIPIHLMNMYDMDILHPETRKSFEDLAEAYPFYPKESIDFIGPMTRSIMECLNIKLDGGGLVLEIAAILTYKYLYPVMEAANLYQGLIHSGRYRDMDSERVRNMMHCSNKAMICDIASVLPYLDSAPVEQLGELVTSVPHNIYNAQDAAVTIIPSHIV